MRIQLSSQTIDDRAADQEPPLGVRPLCRLRLRQWASSALGATPPIRSSAPASKRWQTGSHTSSAVSRCHPVACPAPNLDTD